MPATQFNFEWKWGAIFAVVIQIALTFYIVANVNTAPPESGVKDEIQTLRAETAAGFKTLGDKLGSPRHGSAP